MLRDRIVLNAAGQKRGREGHQQVAAIPGRPKLGHRRQSWNRLNDRCTTGLLEKRSRILLSAFGAGLTWGAGIIEWEGTA